MNSFSTPVLLLIFNRPDPTVRLINALRIVKPRKVYVSADGPRAWVTGEAESCENTRAVIQQIDWDCEIVTNFAHQNKGCKNAVSTGISWFFSYEPEGIILEDDCIPNKSFFSFCEQMLDMYRNDHEVGHIGGTNFQDGKIIGNASYYFSKYPHIWGWATWRRAWQLYDLSMRNLDLFLSMNTLRKSCEYKSELYYWADKFQKAKNGEINTWDYQWVFALWFYGKKSIIPNLNLVENIGFSEIATHTKKIKKSLANIKTTEMGTISHPFEQTINIEADSYTYMSCFKRHLLRNIVLAAKYELSSIGRNTIAVPDNKLSPV